MLESKFEPDWYSPPGDTIAEILAVRNLSLAEFAGRLDYSISFADDLLQGVADIDLDVARRLQEVLGPSVAFWINRETQYRQSATRAESLREVASDRNWLQQLPVGDMVKFGWISPGRTIAGKVTACLDFFGVPDVKTWREAYHGMLSVAAFRTPPRIDANPSAVSAWLRWGELKSAEIPCANWDAIKFRGALTDIRRLTRLKSPERFLPQLTRLCAESGVAVVVARAPSKCRASGATRFLSKNKAMMILSFRYLSDDQFWFTFYHEAGHLLLHGMDALFLEDGSDLTAVEEQEANDFAATLLIPSEFRPALLELAPRVRTILRFARNVGVSPGIVVGQLQHLGRIGPNRLNRLKRRYSWVRASPGTSLSAKIYEF